MSNARKEPVNPTLMKKTNNKIYLLQLVLENKTIFYQSHSYLCYVCIHVHFYSFVGAKDANALRFY